MHRLFLYNNLHCGDILFSRPLYREIIASGQFELILAAFRNNAYLLEDLVDGGHVQLHVSEYLESGPAVLFDLRAACPGTHLPVSTWLGEYRDTQMHQWFNVVEVFNRQMAAYGIDYRVPCSSDWVPMVDFARRHLAPMVQGPAIYIDNSQVRSMHSEFVFDVAALSARFPDTIFVCTASPGYSAAANVVDGTYHDLRDLSEISNQCVAILGKGSGPLCCTYTEANRFKPRAVCGYHSTTSPTFWDYPGSPVQHLDTMQQVIEFVGSALADSASTSEHRSVVHEAILS